MLPGNKRADPDAMIGGPALALSSNNSWLGNLLDFTRNNNLPMDFLSAHAYDDSASAIGGMRNALTARNNFTLPMMLTEYASYPVNGSISLGINGRPEKVYTAMRFF